MELCGPAKSIINSWSYLIFVPKHAPAYPTLPIVIAPVSSGFYSHVFYLFLCYRFMDAPLAKFHLFNVIRGAGGRRRLYGGYDQMDNPRSALSVAPSGPRPDQHQAAPTDRRKAPAVGRVRSTHHSVSRTRPGVANNPTAGAPAHRQQAGPVGFGWVRALSCVHRFR